MQVTMREGRYARGSIKRKMRKGRDRLKTGAMSHGKTGQLSKVYASARRHFPLESKMRARKGKVVLSRNDA
jgi:hypothetical protein